MNLYDASCPVYIRSLENLSRVLKKGEQWASDNGKSESDMMEARLAPDMGALPFQVQLATNTAKAVLPRVAGAEAIKWEDNENTFAQLYDRVDKTLALLKEAKREDFDGKEDVEVVLMEKYKFSALVYMQVFGLPNFFFHITTAYDILRNQGVPVGKADFLGV